MCDLIFLGLPARTAASLGQSLPDGLRLIDHAPPEMRSLLPGGYVAQAVVTENGCSCGLYRDPDEDRLEERQVLQRTLEARRRRYRKRGWSEARIERALVDSAQAHESSREVHLELDLEVHAGLEVLLRRCAAGLPDGLWILVQHLAGPEFGEVRTPERRVVPSRLRLRPDSIDYDQLVRAAP